MDRRGIIVYSDSIVAQLCQPGTRISLDSPAHSALAGKAAVAPSFHSAMGGRLRMGAAAPIPNEHIKWATVANTAVSQVLAAPIKSTVRDIAVSLLVAAASLAGAILLGRRFLRPLATLQRAAKDIAHGDLSARTHYEGTDELAQTAAVFDHMAERIQALVAQREQFLQVAAHELRNPMTSVKGMLSLVRHRAATGRPVGDLEQLAGVMENEIDRLSDLLNEILEAFRIHDGRLTLMFEAVDLTALVKSALKPFSVATETHRFLVMGRGRFLPLVSSFLELVCLVHGAEVQVGCLILSNGKRNEPLRVSWQWDVPKLVEIGWDGQQYELRATYAEAIQAAPQGDKVAGIDLGEVHLAVAHDGERCIIANGRLLRSKRRYQNKLKPSLSHLIDTKQRGSRRRRRLTRSKRRQLAKLDHQIRDIQHKQTTALISTLHASGVQKVVIGDMRDVRQDLNYGHKANQKLHQMLHGATRHMLTYKATRLGMATDLQDEAYTSQTCPACGHRHKPSGREYRCACGFRYHRDGVGSWNIRQKYLGSGPVVGAMASPSGVRYRPHMRCSSAFVS
ncbi:MAG: RNA-guided endonuclease TnpB family protein [Symbiobacteriia bacterium]